MALQVEIQTNRDGTFSVKALFRLPMEEMWETATHVARFEDRAMAEALASRVIAKTRADRRSVFDPLTGINKDWWQGPTSAASPIRWDAKHEPFRVGA